MDKKIKVLVVDDESDVMQPTVFWLKLKGYAVETASSGPDAIEMVKKDVPDIMFLDLKMPGMDGFETLKKIREFNKDLPIIIISAYLEGQERMREINSMEISGVFFKDKDFKEATGLLEAALRTHKKLKKS